MPSLLSDPHRRHLLLTLLVGAGLAVYLIGWFPSILGLDLAMLLALGGGMPIYFDALSALARRKMSANLAVSLAAFAALYVGYAQQDPSMYAVAAEVILIVLIGETLEHFAVGRTRQGIAALLTLRPEEARVRRDGREEIVPAKEIRRDDVVLVRPGDRIPVDGRVVAGSSSIDQSPITGESLPADKTPGDEVFAGTINLYGALELSVERLGEDTTLEQIIHLVEEAEAAKAPSHRLADRCAAYFVPAVLLAAGLTYVFTGETYFSDGDIIRAVAVLVVACPCALVLATPTAIAAGIGGLVRRGVLIKGGVVLENLGRLRSVVFDKTGTLTLAKLRISQIVPAAGHDETGVLRLAASVERHSEHPVGRLIVEEAASRQADLSEATDFVAHPGLGAEAVVSGAKVRVGSPRFIREAGVAVPEEVDARVAELSSAGCTVVLVTRGAETVGAVAVEDTIRPEARETIRRLRALGIDRIEMLTGDNAAAAESVADALSIERVQSGLLPADKVDAVRRIAQEAGPVAMVGDGINDAPSLATADVGVAMADIGTDVAIASADLVLVGDDLRKLVEAIAHGRRALRIVWQNILGFALIFNVVAVAAASLGWIGPVMAAVVHQVSSLTVVLNSLRLLVDLHRWRRRLEHAWEETCRRWRLLLAVGFAAAVSAYILSGFHVVGIGQIAVVRQFGKIVHEAEPPGLHYRLPYPFGRHQTICPEEIRRVEVGFRSIAGSLDQQTPAYEWNVQHRTGRHQRRSDEATVLTGDENLVDVNLIVQYRVADPVAALVRIGQLQSDGTSKWDALVRGAAEAALRAEMSQRPIEHVLNSHREEIERAVRQRTAGAMQDYGTGFVVQSVCLGDVHPPLEVVPAFREVASALEEKEAQINEAQAYQYEREAQARGEAERRICQAEAAAEDRTQRSRGRAQRFAARADAYRLGSEVTRLRLYLQTVEQSLAGRRKVILDRAPDGARRQVFLGRKGLWNLAPALSTPRPAEEVETPRNLEP